MTRPQIAGLVAVLLLGYMLGISIGSDDTQTVYRPVEITKTETVEVPVRYTPEGCDELIIEADEILRNANRLDSATTTVLDLISDLRIAAVEGDTNKATKIENTLRVVAAETIGASENIGLTTPRFEAASAACKE